MQNHHWFRFAEQSRYPRLPRRTAGRRRNRPDPRSAGLEHAPFDIPSDIYAQWDAKEAGQAKEAAWNEKFAAYAKAFPQEAAEFTRRMKGEMPSDFDAKANEFIAKLQANPAKIASRKASQNAIEAFGPLLPEFLGGSADLAPSNLDPVVWF